MKAKVYQTKVKKIKESKRKNFTVLATYTITVPASIVVGIVLDFQQSAFFIKLFYFLRLVQTCSLKWKQEKPQTLQQHQPHSNKLYFLDYEKLTLGACFTYIMSSHRNIIWRKSINEQ